MRHTYSRCQRILLGSRRSLAATASAIAAMLIWCGSVPLAAAGDAATSPGPNRAALSEIAQDVLRRGKTRVPPSIEERISLPGSREEELATVDGPPDPTLPLAHKAPVRQGISVAIPAGSVAPKTAILHEATVGYQSNSWRQAPRETARALSFSSGVLAPSTGLDPALKAHAKGLQAGGRRSVYGFLLLRVPADRAVEDKLARLGVTLLGPHDDHHKARLPVGALEAVAALPEVEWVGVSAREQKLSLELDELRGARAAGIDAATPIPIVINLFEADESGAFKERLAAAGAALGEYDADLMAYRAVASGPVIDRIAALDFVLFVEPIELTSGANDQSTVLVDADMIRSGTISYGVTRFPAVYIPLGILDTGYADAHDDLNNKTRCWANFTDEAAGAFTDGNGHGTHVAGTIAGHPDIVANRRYKGVASGLGEGAGTSGGVVAVKIWKNDMTGSAAWMENAMGWMGEQQCSFPRPPLVNLSGGFTGSSLTGTDSVSRKLDSMVWVYNQLYVVAAGNEGSAIRSIRSPGVAKNALTVGSVVDYGDVLASVGDIAFKSSRGPTGDGRMKPNLVAPGLVVTSAQAGTTDAYANKGGTSMAAAHVTGLAATLMEHYPYFQLNPSLLRAHMMATSMAHDDVTGKSNDYGLGRVAGYIAHWDHTNNDGWSTYRFDGSVNSYTFQYEDITVPPGAQRLVVALTWDEPSASAGASRAVMYDVDLWVDYNLSCGQYVGACGTYSSRSTVDNVEYVVVDNPPAGNYRLKVFPANTTGITLPYGMAALVIRGDTKPAVNAFLTAPSSPVLVGSTFGVSVQAFTPSFVASAVQVEPYLSYLPGGVSRLNVETTRLDGVPMSFVDGAAPLTLGNLVPIFGRSATWNFRAVTPGLKDFYIRVSWENGGEQILHTTVEVVPDMATVPDLIQTAMTSNPATPLRAPGTTFSITDTVQNTGSVRSGSSTTRYYLSEDAVKSADDTLLTGTHSAHGLDPGASHTATATVTIPATTAPRAYFLIACADDQGVVVEGSETNNCIASPGATVTVARPDLAVMAAAPSPSAPARAPGTTFSVTDTVRNVGAVASGPSTTRYYLSLDPVKAAGDPLLTGSRSVPGLAAGAMHSGTVTLTIPTATALQSYFLLACADDLARTAESDEGNNCVATPTAVVTVTRPDLRASSVSAPPASKARRTSLSMTDTVQNGGAVASGPSATRYYLSVDAVKSADDIPLTGSRGVPALAAGASHSGGVSLTISAGTPLNTYFVLACADGAGAVPETDEANNCIASGTRVTITP